MKSEDLDAFLRFEIWHFDDSSAYLLAGTKTLSEEKGFSADMKSKKLLHLFLLKE